eukprot:CAMPEP_0181298068 /NCGR_PEP_ID=MMETSP1101-20121128/5585_1 /TAXON_ID=46948 /ORGANISM="Rhodomonas abbreviata, Strain Caron Lab Isolate" /LENGTH=579 /DNA_ID=CAMNT_0023403065 /DNA_START=66 /DNA_END=1805 /DNA_ORIENTATION=+
MITQIDEEKPLDEVDGVDAELVRSVYRSAISLFRSEIWKKIKIVHLIGVKAGHLQENVPLHILSVVGGGEIPGHITGDCPLGISAYSSLEDAKQVGSGNASYEAPPPGGWFKFSFVPKPAVMFEGNWSMEKRLGLEVVDRANHPEIVFLERSHNGSTVSQPDKLQLRWFDAVTKALPIFASKLQWIRQKQDGTTLKTVKGIEGCFTPLTENIQVEVCGESVTVTLSYPAMAILPEYGDRIPLPSEMCSACYGFKSKTSLCSRCKAVRYCSGACQKADWRQHKSSCNLLKEWLVESDSNDMSHLFSFPCLAPRKGRFRIIEQLGVHNKGLWKRVCDCCNFGRRFGSLEHDDGWHLPPDACPPDAPLLPAPGPFTDWLHYYASRNLPLSSPVALLLTYPLTVLHALHILHARGKLEFGGDVTVHYLGPEKELDFLPVFKELGHCLPDTRLHLIMVGPAPRSKVLKVNLLPNLEVSILQGSYQRIVPSLPKADVAVALNSGLEEDEDLWPGALQALHVARTPAFFTDLAMPSCANALSLLSQLSIPVAIPPHPNPFRSPLRDKQPMVKLQLCENGFLFAVNL